VQLTVIERLSNSAFLLSLKSRPLSFIRQYLSYDDFLEDKREDCQNRSVLYCITLLYNVRGSFDK